MQSEIVQCIMPPVGIIGGEVNQGIDETREQTTEQRGEDDRSRWMYEQKDGDDFVLGRMPLREGYASMTIEPRLAVSRPINEATRGMGAMRWVHYPSMTNNHIMEDYGVLHRVLPVDAETTLLTCYWIVHRDAVEGQDPGG